MSGEVQINIARLTEIHGHIESARRGLLAVSPNITQGSSISPALTAFKERVDCLSTVVDALSKRLEADSRSLLEVSAAFMDEDDSLAQAYQSQIGSSLHAHSSTTSSDVSLQGRSLQEGR